MSQITVKKSSLVIGSLAAAVVGLGVTLALTLPGPSCLGDPTSAIQGLPPGGIWNGGGSCYTLNDGIKVTKPVTIENATLNDTQTAPLPGEQNGKPIVDIVRTHDVTLSNLDLFGAKTQGQFSGMAKQSGVTVTSGSSIAINGVTTENQFSDGFELIGAQNVTMGADTVVNSGRQGVTFDGVSNVSVTGLNVEKTASPSALDFESDLAGIGAGNVSVSGSQWNGTLSLVEYLTGPITFTNDRGVGHLQFGLKTTSAVPITVTGGSYQIPGNVKANTAAINVNGRSVSFTDVGFTRFPSNVLDAPAYGVIDGGHLTLTRSPIPPPPGFHDATSSVTIVP